MNVFIYHSQAKVISNAIQNHNHTHIIVLSNNKSLETAIAHASLPIPMNPLPHPPLPNPLINLVPTNPIRHHMERNPQLRLHIPIPMLIIKEQHLLIRNPTRFLDALEMLRL